jgi:hypothetical protein
VSASPGVTERHGGLDCSQHRDDPIAPQRCARHAQRVAEPELGAQRQDERSRAAIATTIPISSDARRANSAAATKPHADTITSAVTDAR